MYVLNEYIFSIQQHDTITLMYTFYSHLAKIHSNGVHVNILTVVLKIIQK